MQLISSTPTADFALPWAAKTEPESHGFPDRRYPAGKPFAFSRKLALMEPVFAPFGE
jgi:hypothetical protein